ncbi:hypothetical protein HK102_000939 [Quaeritorhiza haematococci]|nr:hypothetical protein HK102_000939 [Quaeritorhiza haematococci]
MSSTDDQLLEAFERSASEQHIVSFRDSGSEDGNSDDENAAEFTNNPFRDDPNAPANIDRILEDNQVRQQLGIGSAFTGPKGVLADYRFHQEQEKARAKIVEQQRFQNLERRALSRGWLQRELEREKAQKEKTESELVDETQEEDLDELFKELEDEIEDRAELDDEDRKVLSAYRSRRLAEIKALVEATSGLSLTAGRKRFGSLKEISVNEYVKSIDEEDPSVTIVVHLYHERVEACRTVNNLLAHVARKYPTTKFVKIISTKADSSFDEVALPALLCYRGGDLFATLLRISDEIPALSKTGRCDPEDLEELLTKNGVLKEDDIVDNDA